MASETVKIVKRFIKTDWNFEISSLDLYFDNPEFTNLPLHGLSAEGSKRKVKL